MAAFLRSLFQLAIGGVAAIVGLYLIFWLALFAFIGASGVYIWLIANPRYAAGVFDGVVPYGRVLASRQWHPVFGPGYNCTFAVVELDETAPTAPPKHDNEAKVSLENIRQASDFRLVGDWKPTPAQGDPWVWTDGMEAGLCDPYPGDELVARLREAVEMPGGWYHTNGEVLVVYSKPAGLAFRFRSGD